MGLEGEQQRESAIAFYRDLIGFDLVARVASAAFVSAGGYHHHLGFNVWRGQGVRPRPPGTVGLRHWSIVLPETQDVADVRERLATAGVKTLDVAGGFAVRDPWGIALHVVAG